MDEKDFYFMFSVQVLRYFLWYRVWVHADSMLLSAGPGHWLLGMQILMGYYYVEIGYFLQIKSIYICQIIKLSTLSRIKSNNSGVSVIPRSHTITNRVSRGRTNLR